MLEDMEKNQQLNQQFVLSSVYGPGLVLIAEKYFTMLNKLIVEVMDEDKPLGAPGRNEDVRLQNLVFRGGVRSFRVQVHI